VYDFWGYVHNETFPSKLRIGRLDSYALTTREIVLDIISRDIDSRYMVIPNSFSIDDVSVDTDELGEETGAIVYDYFKSYLSFRSADRQLKKQRKSADVPSSVTSAANK
jgi:hypothetical protein